MMNAYALEILFLFFFLGHFKVSCVTINSLLVPEVATKGASVILDCDYSVEGPQDEGLVVKWFFNQRHYPVYQWIPGSTPRELGALKGRLDLTYKASQDRNKEHRALKITSLGPELSGNFTCLVASFSSEDIQTKRMLVLVPEKILELRLPTFRDRTKTSSKIIMCLAEEIFPKPEIRLFLNNSEPLNSTVEIKEIKSGLFNIEISSEVESLEDGSEVVCELQIPEANYTIKKEAIYYQAWMPAKNNKSNVFPSSLTIVMSTLCIFYTFCNKYFYNILYDCIQR